MPEGAHDQVGDRRFADDDDGHGGQHGKRRLHEHGRVQQHADRDEEQHCESVAQRHGFLGRLLAEVALAHHHAGKEGAECKGDAEQLGGAEGDTERDGIDGEPERFARAGMRRVVHQPGNDTAADHQHYRHEDRDLGQRHQQRKHQPAHGNAVAGEHDGHGRQQHQR